LHAVDRGASLPEVQATLGHGNIATTSGYLHARPQHVEWPAPGSGSVSSMTKKAMGSDKDAG
jgi:hypothetical protein